MLRPATPLAIIFFLAFVLLLLSTISMPIIKQIPLARFQGWDFGVFGYCNQERNICLGPQVGYSTDGLFSGNDADDFSLPSSTRNSLSSILIVHPVAALLTFICFALAVAAHFHAPAHSPRYLLALLILTIPTLLVTLLAFLVDILLFIPHVQWGGWIVLAATILIVASSVVTCAMRRTLVSRKARKKRIAENADMNGANYYEHLTQNRMMADELPKAESPPPMSGSTAMDSKAAPQFATFEMKRHETNSQDGGRRSMDDRTPLNPTPNQMREPSIRSASTGGGPRRPYRAQDAPPMPMDGQAGMGAQRRPSRDEYGNPLPPMAVGAMAGGMAGGMAGEMPPRGLRHHNSQGSMGSNRSGGRGGAPPYYGRGRGGYGPPRGGYGPPRGGYGPARGGYGPRGGFRGGPPPPGWNGRGRGGYGPPPPGMIPGMGHGPRGPPPPGYGGDGYYGPPRGGPPPMDRPMDRPPPAQMPQQDQFTARGPSPSNTAPIGQAIEMDERTGSPPGAVPPQHEPYGLRDSDDDVMGMVGLQQDRRQNQSPMNRPNGHDSTDLVSPSIYSTDNRDSTNTYVPPRAAWAQKVHGVSPLGHDSTSSDRSYNLSPIQASPTSPPSSQTAPAPLKPRHARADSQPYYEDVDPRFAAPEPHHDASPGADEAGTSSSNTLPSALTPGGAGGSAYRMAPSPSPYQTELPDMTYTSPSVSPSSRHFPPLSTMPFHGTLRGGEDVEGSTRGEGDVRQGFPGRTSDVPHSSPLLDHPSPLPPDHDSLSPLSPPNQTPSPGVGVGDADSSTENLPAGMRSPTGSDTSHFTSISQRGINPNWRPSPQEMAAQQRGGGFLGPPSGFAPGVRGGGGGGGSRRDDVILNANPDFAIPGVGVGRVRGGGRGGMGRGGLAGRGGAMGAGVLGGMGMSGGAGGVVPGGRYPLGEM